MKTQENTVTIFSPIDSKGFFTSSYENLPKVLCRYLSVFDTGQLFKHAYQLSISRLVAVVAD